eukprot:GHVP01035278.1.p1 GENE.GHVP01035278.1~~GHVP01035278.1.p1  ORF type:complete len:848 (+),score=123.81 GHVP01035278.1:20-2563(+)
MIFRNAPVTTGWQRHCPTGTDLIEEKTQYIRQQEEEFALVTDSAHVPYQPNFVSYPSTVYVASDFKSKPEEYPSLIIKDSFLSHRKGVLSEIRHIWSSSPSDLHLWSMNNEENVSPVVTIPVNKTVLDVKIFRPGRNSCWSILLGVLFEKELAIYPLIILENSDDIEANYCFVSPLPNSDPIFSRVEDTRFSFPNDNLVFSPTKRSSKNQRRGMVLCWDGNSTAVQFKDSCIALDALFENPVVATSRRILEIQISDEQISTQSVKLRVNESTLEFPKSEILHFIVSDKFLILCHNDKSISICNKEDRNVKSRQSESQESSPSSFMRKVASAIRRSIGYEKSIGCLVNYPFSRIIEEFKMSHLGLSHLESVGDVIKITANHTKNGRILVITMITSMSISMTIGVFIGKYEKFYPIAFNNSSTVMYKSYLHHQRNGCFVTCQEPQKSDHSTHTNLKFYLHPALSPVNTLPSSISLEDIGKRWGCFETAVPFSVLQISEEIPAFFPTSNFDTRLFCPKGSLMEGVDLLGYPRRSFVLLGKSSFAVVEINWFGLETMAGEWSQVVQLFRTSSSIFTSILNSDEPTTPTRKHLKGIMASGASLPKSWDQEAYVKISECPPILRGPWVESLTTFLCLLLKEIWDFPVIEYFGSNVSTFFSPSYLQFLTDKASDALKSIEDAAGKNLFGDQWFSSVPPWTNKDNLAYCLLHSLKNHPFVGIASPESQKDYIRYINYQSQETGLFHQSSFQLHLIFLQLHLVTQTLHVLSAFGGLPPSVRKSLVSQCDAHLPGTSAALFLESFGNHIGGPICFMHIPRLLNRMMKERHQLGHQFNSIFENLGLKAGWLLALPTTF